LRIKTQKVNDTPRTVAFDPSWGPSDGSHASSSAWRSASCSLVIGSNCLSLASSLGAIRLCLLGFLDLDLNAKLGDEDAKETDTGGSREEEDEDEYDDDDEDDWDELLGVAALADLFLLGLEFILNELMF